MFVSDNENNENKYRKFIPFCQPKFYFWKGKTYRGYVDLAVTCCTDLYIGSGFSFIPENESEFVYSPILVDGKPIIPGSSFKGVVRNIASIVSNGCLSGIDLKKDKLPDKIKNITCDSSQCCIVCDVFGMMGRGSKVIFSDMHSDNARLKIVKMNKQYSPKEYKDKSDGRVLGYKIYPTGENKFKANSEVKVQVVDKGAVFKGRIHFKKLTEEELCLLMFSMGLDKGIRLKIGGYKNQGIGEVEVTASEFICSIDKKGTSEGPAEKVTASYIVCPDVEKTTPEELAARWRGMNCADKNGVNSIIKELKAPN